MGARLLQDRRAGRAAIGTSSAFIFEKGKGRRCRRWLLFDTEICKFREYLIIRDNSREGFGLLMLSRAKATEEPEIF